MSKLPLKAQVAIRDYWQHPASAHQKVVGDLKAVLGQEVVIEPEWHLLVTELDSTYSCKELLIAAVVTTVQAWAISMRELLEDEANADWTDTVLDNTAKAGGRLQIFVDVAALSGNVASTAWSSDRQGFVISLPRGRRIDPTDLPPVFRGQLLGAFGPEIKPKAVVAHGTGDDWANIEMDTTTGAVDLVVDLRRTTLPTGANAPKVDYLPTLESLPKPDELLLRPPYHMVVYASIYTGIEVQGSHSPSLKLLADYLKRWCRANVNDTRSSPAVEVKLHQSAFGLAEMFDRVVLSTEKNQVTNKFRVTAPIVLSFIEGVLGYELVAATPTNNVASWGFRRDTAFKIL